jgi:hypothetical protein
MPIGLAIARIERIMNRNPRVQKRISVNRTTVFRWRKGEHLPVNAEAALTFAAELDLDPVALWDFDGPEERMAFWHEVIEAGRTEGWEPLALRSCAAFASPSDRWPPSGIAARYLDDRNEPGKRRWTTYNAHHTARAVVNVYRRFRIRSLHKGPAVLHFAWRHDRPNSPWNPYGFVLRELQRVTRYDAGGRELVVGKRCTEFCVETKYGEGAARFRIACLHPFEVQEEDASQRPASRELATVRFG